MQQSNADLVSLLDGTAEGKKLFYRFIKKWHNFLDSLDKKDRLILMKMILKVCSYNEDISCIINTENSESYSNRIFFLLTMMIQQKLLLVDTR